MRPLPIGALMILTIAGCAALGPRTEGVAGPIRYRATDLELARRTIDNRELWFYSFSVHVTELQGRELVFNEIETTVYQPGTRPWSPVYRGKWKLPAHGELRIPLATTLACRGPEGNCSGPNVPMPLWQITLTGTDDRDEPIRLVIDLTSAGSWSNDVLYAYFTLSPPVRIWLLPPSFQEFNPHTDSSAPSCCTSRGPARSLSCAACSDGLIAAFTPPSYVRYRSTSPEACQKTGPTKNSR